MRAWSSRRTLAPLEECLPICNPKLYHKDSYHYSNILQSSTNSRFLKQTHAQIITAGHQHNPFLAANLLSRYAAVGAQGLGDSRQVFDRVPQRDVLFWNVMIQAYSNSASSCSEAIQLYNKMRGSSVSPNCYTYPFVLKACGAAADERRGRAVHAHAVVDGLYMNLFICNALVAFYARCGEIDAARKVFDWILVKDIVSWNAMISGYAQNNLAYEAIALLHQMLQDDTVNKPDQVTLVALLPACASLSAVQEGLWAHSYAIKMGMEIDAGLGSGLIATYASCGCLDTARKVFDIISDKNLILCNSMIQAYGMHGHASEALDVFLRMLEIGVHPDGICFVSVLSACSHVGMVDKGREVFVMMDTYGLEKSQVHYACMVDLLGRAGQLREAVEFIEKMPVEPEKDVWGALLGACRVHNDLELAEEAAKRLFLLDPENAGRYMALARMYEDAGRWGDAARLRKAMRDRGVKKPVGCSMVEVDREVHTFEVEAKSHIMEPEIYDVLDHLHRVAGVEEESQVAN